MLSSSAPEAEGPTTPASPGQADGLAEAELQALAEKVYALLKQELRLERERYGHDPLESFEIF